MFTLALLFFIKPLDFLYSLLYNLLYESRTKPGIKMSTGFGYYCNDCREQSVNDLNWGDVELVALYDLQRHVLPVFKKQGWIDNFVEFKNDDYIDFLIAHKGHDLMLCTEYGDTFPLWGKARYTKRPPWCTEDCKIPYYPLNTFE